MAAPPRTKIWVVSLPSAHDRRRGFAQQAQGAATPWSFFDAHRELSSDLLYTPALAERHHGRVLQPGELGCYSSHYTLWKRLLSDAEADQYVVLEDDLLVDWAMLAQIAAHDFTGAGHPYVRLYYKRPNAFREIRRGYLHRGCSLIQLYGPAWGTQGYVIGKPAAERLVAACREVRRPIDDAMDRYWEHGVPNLSLFPFPVLERQVTSAIGQQRFAASGTVHTKARRAQLRREDRIRRAAFLRAAVAARIRRHLRSLVGRG